MHISALYESVTNSIIADLEKGVAPWVQPWKNGLAYVAGQPVSSKIRDSHLSTQWIPLSAQSWLRFFAQGAK
jgi:antirestriction protein ArdC